METDIENRVMDKDGGEEREGEHANLNYHM